MENIVLLGQLQQELDKRQIVSIISAIKKEAGENCHIFCNGSGMFLNTAELEKQTEMLFNAGIDVMFLGEQAICRAAGRKLLLKNEYNLLRPLNMSEKAPGKGAKKVKFNNDEMWLISLTDHTGKIPADPADYEIIKFFQNKRDDFNVLINVNGLDFRYKEALAWKIKQLDPKAVLFGSGSGYYIPPAIVNNEMGFEKAHFIPDIGAVVTLDSIGGISPEIWWERNINKIPINVSGAWGALRCDFTVIYFDDGEKIQKTLHKVVKI